MDMTAVGDKLQGAKVIHNHPDSQDYYGGCFSMNDFSTFFEYQLKRLEVVSGLGRYSLEYEGNPVYLTEAKKLYRMAWVKSLNFAFKNLRPVEYEQLNIIKCLAKEMQGLKFRKCDK